MSESETLGDKLPEECARVRELIGIYREHCGPAGGLAVSLMERALQRADRAMINGDLQAMIVAYQDLQGFTE